jgi:hypothetical protein
MDLHQPKQFSDEMKNKSSSFARDLMEYVGATPDMK